MKALVRDHEVTELRPHPLLTGEGLSEVRIEMVGLCWTDLWVADGSKGAPYPIVLGHEACGRTSDGRQVAIFPWWEGRQLGVERDGLLTPVAWLPESLLRTLPSAVDPRRVVYAEPVCAALSVMESGIKKQERGLVCGRDRLALLTQRVLLHHGFEQVELGEPSGGYYDFVVEGLDTEIPSLMGLLRPRGRLLVKRRSSRPLVLDRALCLPRELVLEFCFYGSFERAVDLVADPDFPLEDLFGPAYALSEFGRAFEHAASLDRQKVFLRCAES